MTLKTNLKALEIWTAHTLCDVGILYGAYKASPALNNLTKAQTEFIKSYNLDFFSEGKAD